MSLKDFQMLSKLGEGAFSIVYKVKRLIDNQLYALKKVKMNNLSEKQKQNALNEVRILASINHPNIISYKEAFIEKGTNYLCIIMEYADEGDLLERIKIHQKNNTHFSEEDVWSNFIQITRGLRVLHQMKILHRDIKSANVFLTKSGYAKLGDLNVAKMVKSMSQTQTGTPYYASPQIWKDKPYDKKSDIWSLGCVLYEMIALKPPFRANDMQGLYKKVSRGFYSRLPPEYSQDLSIVLKLMLQVAPHLRSSCEKILDFPILMKNMIFLPQLLQSNQSKQKPHDLMKTIRIEEKVGTEQLKNKIQLPKPRYSDYKHDIQQQLLRSNRNIVHFKIEQKEIRKSFLPSISRTLDYDQNNQSHQQHLKNRKKEKYKGLDSGKSAVLRKGPSNSLIQPRVNGRFQLPSYRGETIENRSGSNNKLEGRLRQLSPDVIRKLIKKEKERYKIKSIIGNY